MKFETIYEIPELETIRLVKVEFLLPNSSVCFI